MEMIMPETFTTPIACPASSLLNKAIDNAALCHDCFHDLGSLFKAIRITSTKKTTAYELAGIGQYLADEWGNTIDCECETLNELKQAFNKQ
jgi:hypothetical protein